MLFSWVKNRYLDLVFLYIVGLLGKKWNSVILLRLEGIGEDLYVFFKY